MSKKLYKAWEMKLPNGVVVAREESGNVFIGGETLDPKSARRLNQKLSGDYKD